MEAEVEGLRKQLEELTTATPDEADTISDLKKELDEKERALYTLQVGSGVAVCASGEQGRAEALCVCCEERRIWRVWTMECGSGPFKLLL